MGFSAAPLDMGTARLGEDWKLMNNSHHETRLGSRRDSDAGANLLRRCCASGERCPVVGGNGDASLAVSWRVGKTGIGETPFWAEISLPRLKAGRWGA